MIIYIHVNKCYKREMYEKNNCYWRSNRTWFDEATQSVWRLMGKMRGKRSEKKTSYNCFSNVVIKQITLSREYYHASTHMVLSHCVSPKWCSSQSCIWKMFFSVVVFDWNEQNKQNNVVQRNSYTNIKSSTLWKAWYVFSHWHCH